MSYFRGTQPFCGLLLVLLLAGCSGSNKILEGTGGRPVQDEVTGALQKVVLPAMRELAAFSPVNQPAPPRAAASDPKAPDCARFDPLCRSGRFDVCRSALDGPVVFRFERCVRSGTLLNGKWELFEDGLRASAVFDLELDDLALSGRIEYVLNDMCWRKELESFHASRQGYSASLSGSVEYCFGAGMRSGRLQVAVDGPANPFDMLLEFDDARGGNAVVAHGEVATMCRFDPHDGVASCEAD